MLKAISALLIGLLSAQLASGQDESCACCTYSSLQFKDDFTGTFPAQTIKANRIKELTVYTTGRQLPAGTGGSGPRTIIPEYRETILYFNADGYVTRQIVFSSLGRFHSEYAFARNGQNQVTLKSFSYLDSIGRKTAGLIPDQQWKYAYSAGGKITRIKELDYRGKEQPDAKSTYSAYAYDEQGRLSGKIWQQYIDEGSSTMMTTRIKYLAPTQSTATTLDGKRPFTVVQTRYAPDGQPVLKRTFDGDGRKLLTEESYTYNASKQLVKYQTKNSGMETECADGGNYTDAYEYSPQQLISRIAHSYGNKLCELRFVYR